MTAVGEAARIGLAALAWGWDSFQFLDLDNFSVVERFGLRAVPPMALCAWELAVLRRPFFRGGGRSCRRGPIRRSAGPGLSEAGRSASVRPKRGVAWNAQQTIPSTLSERSAHVAWKRSPLVRESWQRVPQSGIPLLPFLCLASSSSRSRP